MTELIVILVVALLIFGPARLPELARSIGKGLAEFRRASTDLRRSLYDVTDPTHDEEAVPPSGAPQALASPQPAQETDPPREAASTEATSAATPPDPPTKQG